MSVASTSEDLTQEALACGGVDLRSFIKPDADGVYHIAVFDFDGTCIRGNSPVMLVRHLALSGRLSFIVILRIIWWAVRYKFHWPQNESSVRELVFTAFEGKPRVEVDDYLDRFGEENVAKRFRPQAHETMADHVRKGHVVLCLSATFEPILRSIVPQHPIQFQISTRMQVDDQGNYLAKVEGLPVEGREKLNALRRFADKEFGEDKWVLDWAYCDHYSDYELLAAAKHPCAANPTSTLAKIAKREAWPIITWAEPT